MTVYIVQYQVEDYIKDSIEEARIDSVFSDPNDALLRLQEMAAKEKSKIKYEVGMDCSDHEITINPGGSFSWIGQVKEFTVIEKDKG